MIRAGTDRDGVRQTSGDVGFPAATQSPGRYRAVSFQGQAMSKSRRHRHHVAERDGDIRLAEIISSPGDDLSASREKHWSAVGEAKRIADHQPALVVDADRQIADERVRLGEHAIALENRLGGPLSVTPGQSPFKPGLAWRAGCGCTAEKGGGGPGG